MNVWIRLSDLHRVPVKCQNDHFYVFFAVEEFFSCVVRPDLTFLPIKEAVDVGLAQADEG